MDHSNDSGLVSSKKWRSAQTGSPVQARLGEDLGNNLCETCFAILRGKCRENFAKMFGNLTPSFTQPKRRKCSHETPISFPKVFSAVFPDVSVPRKQRVPPDHGFPNQYSPDKEVVLKTSVVDRSRCQNKGWWMAPFLASLGQ